jgi:hypothetical protein
MVRGSTIRHRESLVCRMANRNLAAKAPRTAEGRPDLFGVWHVQSESLEEKRRLFGPDFGTIIVPGMEPDTVSKYARDIWLDSSPELIVMTSGQKS